MRGPGEALLPVVKKLSFAPISLLGYVVSLGLLRVAPTNRAWVSEDEIQFKKQPNKYKMKI